MIHIEGRRWFRKHYGTTYNSVRIWRDGKLVAELPSQYGYGDYFLQRAQAYLGQEFPELAETWENGCPKIQFTEWLRDHDGSYSVIDVTRERDL